MAKEGFVNLVNEGLKEADRQGITKALILAAPLTIEFMLYERSGLQCIYPSAQEQLRVNQWIREVAGGKMKEIKRKS